ISVAALAPSLVYRARKPAEGPSWRFILILASMGLLMACLVTLLAPLAITIIFGTHFAPATHILQIAAFIVVPGFTALGLDAVLIHAGHHRAIPLKWGAGMLVGFLLI